ncbi:uncharacterized protein LOC135093329 isoform X3 [Scylla paramamosain]
MPLKEDSREFVCGWGAAFINITVTFPMNKIMFRQMLHGISSASALRQLRREGLKNLYRGIFPPLCQKTISTSIMFGMYDQYGKLLTYHYPELSKGTTLALAATLAGCTEALLCPFERIQTVLQDKKFHGYYKLACCPIKPGVMCSTCSCTNAGSPHISHILHILITNTFYNINTWQVFNTCSTLMTDAQALWHCTETAERFRGKRRDVFRKKTKTSTLVPCHYLHMYIIGFTVHINKFGFLFSNGTHMSNCCVSVLALLHCTFHKKTTFRCCLRSPYPAGSCHSLHTLVVSYQVHLSSSLL